MLENDSASIFKENELLRKEVQVVRKTSNIKGRVVSKQFVQIEKILQQLEKTESRYHRLRQEARQQEQLYAALLNTIQDAVIILDAELKPIYVNPNFVRTFGFTLEEVQDEQMRFVPAEELDNYCRVLQQVAAGGPIASVETRGQRKDGSFRNVLLSASHYYDHEDGPGGVMLILKDITEHKQGQALLQKQEEVFYDTLWTAPYGVALLDETNRVVYLNPEFTKILGYTMEDISSPGDGFLQAYLLPEQGQRGTGVRNRWEKVHRVRCKSGSIKEIEFKRSVLTDGRSLVVLTDVTARTHTEELIRRAKRQWERTFDAIADAITIQDSEMRIVRANWAAARMVGTEPRQLIGKYCYELFAQQGAPCKGCPYPLTMKDHTPHSSEVEQPLMQRICLVMTAPIFDEDGRFTGIVHTVRDITEQRKIEEELMRAQKLESIGVLAGGIAHDFNNFLTSIFGNISLAKMESALEGKVLVRLEEAEKASMRAKDLTHQLLTFSKGGAPLKKTASIMDLITDSAAFALVGSNVRCDYDLPQHLWATAIDEGQISQVIHNLIINACQAMPEGGKIEIRARNVVVEKSSKLPLMPGRFIKVSVRDYGVGIRPQDIPKVFDPYFSTKSEGNGLGLATSYSVIKRHEGHMTVDSLWGHGTTFQFYLPAAQEQFPVEQAADDEVVLPGNGKGKTLVMDDEEAIRDLAGQMLRFLGYQVEFARDGDEAIQLYRQAREAGAPFDVVLIDLTIPGGMGGKETIKKLKEIDPQIKAVVSSGYYTDPVMSNYRESGFSGVIAKPYCMKELSEVLGGLIPTVRD